MFYSYKKSYKLGNVGIVFIDFVSMFTKLSQSCVTITNHKDGTEGLDIRR